jgi:hypothetical protein
VILLLALQTFFQLQAFEAGHVEMKDKKVLMHSGVRIDQQFGSLNAERIEGVLGENSVPVALQCHGDVELKIKQGGVLKSPFVTIDSTTHLAECFSQDGARVSYEDPEGNYRLQSDRLEMQFIEAAPWVQRIIAEGDVDCLSARGDSLRGSRATLEGPFSLVKLEGPCLLRTASGEEVAAAFAEVDLHGKQALLKGKTVVSIYGEEPKTIRAFGAVKLSKDRLSIESPLEDGKVPEALQAHLEDKRGDIYADQVELVYQEINGKLVPQTLVLTGNVRLLYHSHYALADRGEVDFAKRELILQAIERKGVLFYDQLNKMQASARAMKVTLDPQSDQVKVQGIGTMRLQFKEEEYLEFKKRFLINGF